MSKADKNAALRSGEVRELLEQPPRRIIRWGTALVLVFILLGAVLAWFVRYPETLTVPVFILDNGDAIVKISVSDYSGIEDTQKVSIRLPGPQGENTTKEGEITKTGAVINGNEVQVQVRLPGSGMGSPGFSPGATGEATIITGSKRLLNKVLEQVRWYKVKQADATSP